MIIYKITNTKNGKMYIGQTTGTLEARWHRHQTDALNNILDTHFANAIRLYGPESFIAEEIDTATTQEELTQKEHDWIVHYNSTVNGYNETDAIWKCGGNTYASKTKEEMEIIKDKIRATKMGGKNPQSRKIKCKNVVAGEELFFDSMADATRYFGLTSHQPFSRRCRGEIKSLYNREWAFAYQEEEYRQFSERPNAARTKLVQVLNLETNEKAIFENFHLAEKTYGFSKDSMSAKFRKNGNRPYIQDIYQISIVKD